MKSRASTKNSAVKKGQARPKIADGEIVSGAMIAVAGMTVVDEAGTIGARHLGVKAGRMIGEGMIAAVKNGAVTIAEPTIAEPTIAGLTIAGPRSDGGRIDEMMIVAVMIEGAMIEGATIAEPMNAGLIIARARTDGAKPARGMIHAATSLLPVALHRPGIAIRPPAKHRIGELHSAKSGSLSDRALFTV